MLYVTSKYAFHLFLELSNEVVYGFVKWSSDIPGLASDSIYRKSNSLTWNNLIYGIWDNK